MRKHFAAKLARRGFSMWRPKPYEVQVFSSPETQKTTPQRRGSVASV